SFRGRAYRARPPFSWSRLFWTIRQLRSRRSRRNSCSWRADPNSWNSALQKRNAILGARPSASATTTIHLHASCWLATVLKFTCVTRILEHTLGQIGVELNREV